MIIEHDKYGTIQVQEENLPENYKKISLVIESNKDEIGYVTFKIKTATHRIAWLQKIAVHEKYQSQKFGDMLIKLMEEYLIKHRCDEIEGKFFPTNHHARPFYKKHSYKIIKEDYETYIYKRGLNKQLGMEQ